MNKPYFLVMVTSLSTICSVVLDNPVLAASNPTPEGWSTYINSKYDFDVCYPAVLVAEPGTQAGDGQKFTGPGGGTLIVTWRAGTAGDTLDRTINEEVSGLGASPVVSYTAGARNWKVRSGQQGGDVFYIKVIRRDEDYLLMNVRYPKGYAKSWNAMVSHFAACFESSRPR